MSKTNHKTKNNKSVKLTPKKTNKIKVSFLGGQAEGVTGSICLVEFPLSKDVSSANKETLPLGTKRKILLECGLVQTNSVEKDYKTNLRNAKSIKSKEIEVVFVMHTHIDHIGLLPRLYRDGCTADIIIPKNSIGIMKELLLDCAFIMGKEAMGLQNMYNGKKLKRLNDKIVKENKKQENIQIDKEISTKKRKLKIKDLPKEDLVEVEPIYTEEDVLLMLKYVKEYDIEKTVVLDEQVSFEYLSSHHLINGCQLLLSIKNNNQLKKILHTSDLGNVSMPILFNGHFTPCKQADLVIAETTYAGRDMHTGIDNLRKDLEKLECIIKEVCLDSKQKILIPAFSLDRTQRLLKYIHDILMSNNELKDIHIYIDSPLSKRITDEYLKILEKEEKEMLEDLLNSKNVSFVKTVEDSKSLVATSKPCIILSASGMGKGRVKHHIKNIIENEDAMICVCGYACENTLVYRIKNPKLSNTKIKDGKQKTKAIKIDGYYYKNKCKVMELHSFSSHIQKQDMLKYYSEINYNKIALVHGNFDDKVEFSKELKEEIKKKNKTSQVVVVNKDTVISL